MDSVSQKSMMGIEGEEWPQDTQDLDETFCVDGNEAIAMLDDEGLKTVPPQFSQELLSGSFNNTQGNSSTQESSLGIPNISDTDLGFSDGGLEKMISKVIEDDYSGLSGLPSFPSNSLSQEVELASQSQSQQFLVDPSTFSPYSSDIGTMSTFGKEQVQEPEVKVMSNRTHSRKQVFHQLNTHFKMDSKANAVGSCSSSTDLINEPEPDDQPDSQSQEMDCTPPVDSCSEVSSSQESSQEIPSVVTYAGKYNFRVYPGDPACKQCVFSEARNKLFCLRSMPILFKMEVDWKRVNPKDLTVKAMLVFKSSSDTAKPVTRCINCFTVENQQNPEGDVSILHHVLRSTHTRATYGRSNSNRHHVTAPFDRPQPGSKYVAKTYLFTCLSTCTGIARKEISLVFTLLDIKGKQVGRHCFDLKVCSCPARDCQKEDAKLLQVKKRKSETVGKSAKLRCISPSRENDVADEDSQDSLVEFAVEKIRTIRAIQQSPDPSQRMFGKFARNHLRNFLQSLDSFGDNGGQDEPPQNDQDGNVGVNSPDSGVGAVQTP